MKAEIHLSWKCGKIRITLLKEKTGKGFCGRVLWLSTSGDLITVLCTGSVFSPDRDKVIFLFGFKGADMYSLAVATIYEYGYVIQLEKKVTEGERTQKVKIINLLLSDL